MKIQNEIFSAELPVQDTTVATDDINRILFGEGVDLVLDEYQEGIEDNEYHSLPGISSTDIRQMAISPYHFYSHKLLGNKKKETPALQFGRLAHSALLEPKKFLEKYAVQPKFNKRTTKGKEDYQKWVMDLPRDAIVIDEKDSDLLLNMVGRMWSHPKVPKIFSKGKAELSGWWVDRSTGLLCKTRPDWLIMEDNIYVELKTSETADPKEFARHIYNFGYHYQLAWNSRAYKSITNNEIASCLFVVTEKKPPYDCAVYVADQEMIDIASYEIQNYMQRIKDCVDSGCWEGYSNEIETISLPAWAYKE